MPLRILLADDHQLVRQGLHALLSNEPDLEIVGEAADGAETLRLLPRLKPDILVVDLMMPTVSGLEVLKEVAQRGMDVRVVILTMHANVAYLWEAWQAGAAAYVLKDGTAADLVWAIREAAAGRRFLSPPLSEAALEAYAEQARPVQFRLLETLTPREREVLYHTAEGQSSTEIGRRLFISPRTVESHRANLMRKLGLRNQAELVRYALQEGVLPLKASLPKNP